MNIFDVIVLGIVEGITEFLPVSSTAHLILTGQILGLPQTDFLKSFEIAIQSGAILAAVLFYGKTLLTNRAAILRVCIAFVPTAIIGFLLHDFVKDVLMENPQAILSALFIGGLFMMLFEFSHTEKEGVDVEHISFLQAFAIGLFQSLAIIPGVSRSGATIIGGLSMGMNRKTIVDFSFLLAIPTMAAATGLDLLKSAPAFTIREMSMLVIGFIISFIIAAFSIKWLLVFIKNHSFVSFGIYRILAAIIFWFILI